jgi:hypothetical protein
VSRDSFDDFCRECFDLLKSEKIKYVTIGGVAVLALQHSRARRVFERTTRKASFGGTGARSIGSTSKRSSVQYATRPRIRSFSIAGAS